MGTLKSTEGQMHPMLSSNEACHSLHRELHPQAFLKIIQFLLTIHNLTQAIILQGCFP